MDKEKNAEKVENKEEVAQVAAVSSNDDEIGNLISIVSST